ncbi:hypothetical protein Leryth_025700 [Lithospermum erythrorhizon]|nr:hypothetical protein Leryth_025700 [Lithospermum erythrorhizon]
MIKINSLKSEPGMLEPLWCVVVRRVSTRDRARGDIDPRVNKFIILNHVEYSGLIGVLKIFDLVNELQWLLYYDPWVDFFGYIGNVKRLEEALQLLSANCALAVLWMEDLVQFLQSKIVVDDWYLPHSLRLLKELEEAGERLHLRDGVLMAAFKKLENEFRLLLEKDGYPSPHVIQKVQAIIERFTANDLMRRCVCIYVEARSTIVRTALQALDLDYLHQSLSEHGSIQGIEGCIQQWGKDLEIVVKDLDVEHRLCKELFQKSDNGVWMGCFERISLQSGICDFIRFADTVAGGKKEAIKLLNLLEIFTILDRVRLDFNRLFSGKACLEIQNQTRDLIKKVITCISEIFWDLSVQVELTMILRPPTDGSLPRMVSFVIDFCNQLFEDDYMLVLIQVLEIHRVWSRESFNRESIPLEVSYIIKKLEVNLGIWAEAYKDTAVANIFLMNCHWYLYKNVRGTKLGDLMGEDWLTQQEEYVKHYKTILLKESWERLPSLLSEDDLILFPGGRATDQNLVKKRLQEFTDAFDDIYDNQSRWILSDEELRLSTCRLLLQMVVVPYNDYIQKYVPFMEIEEDSSLYVKYSPMSLQNKISSLFQQKTGYYKNT